MIETFKPNLKILREGHGVILKSLFPRRARLDGSQVVVGVYPKRELLEPLKIVVCCSQDEINCARCPLQSWCPNPYGARVAKEESIPENLVDECLLTRAIGNSLKRS